MKRRKVFIQPTSSAVDSIVPKNSSIIKGTKLIRSDQPLSDLVFKSIDERINREPSVLVWNYESTDTDTTVEIEFLDESPIFRLVFNPHDVEDLERTFNTLDSYFLTRYSRS